LPRIEALAVKRSVYAERLPRSCRPPPSSPSSRRGDAALAGPLIRIDAMIAHATRLRVDHVLAADSSTWRSPRRPHHPWPGRAARKLRERLAGRRWASCLASSRP
jgi:hypothetical protein